MANIFESIVLAAREMEKVEGQALLAFLRGEDGEFDARTFHRQWTQIQTLLDKALALAVKGGIGFGDAKAILDALSIAVGKLKTWRGADAGGKSDRYTDAVGEVQRSLNGLRTLAIAIGERFDPLPLPTPNLDGKRPAFARDHLWLSWADAGSGPADIRDRWNRDYREHGGERIGEGRSGRDVVKAALTKARQERSAMKPTRKRTRK